MKKVFLGVTACVFFILFSTAMQASVIQGTVYQTDLSVAKAAVVKISSVPEQIFVAVTGAYTFAVRPGTYTLSATHQSGNTSQVLTISDDEEYIRDLILFPIITSSELENETTLLLDIAEPQVQKPVSWLAVVIILAAIEASVWYVRGMRNSALELAQSKTKSSSAQISETEQLNQEIRKTTRDEEEQVMAVIRKEGGRTTQKNIRTAVPLSEAKISVIITQLEHEGKIEKIKKGRGNVVILK